jgi:hypothetical protein
MSNNTWQETLINSQVDGPTLANSASAASLLQGAQKLVLPSGFFSAPGKALRIKGAGRLSNIVTTPGTLTLDVRLNTTPIVVFNGGAMQLSTTAHTTLPIFFEILLTCRAIGSGTAANLMGQGVATSQCLALTAVADSATTPATLLMPNTTPAVGTGFDSSIANVLDLFGTFSIANAGNGITLHQFTVESLN